MGARKLLSELTLNELKMLESLCATEQELYSGYQFSVVIGLLKETAIFAVTISNTKTVSVIRGETYEEVLGKLDSFTMGINTHE